ncbi:MAG: flavin reductase family protein [Acidimicrobiia bacterium]
MAVDAERFREVASCFPAGVTVVTALGADGEARALTLSAFCAVSLEPPLVLVCLDKGSSTLSAIRHLGAFTVNVLCAGREELARRLASKAPDKLAGVALTEEALAGPVLAEDACAYLACGLEEAVEAGDHWVLLGRVVAAQAWPERSPLVYWRRNFSMLTGAPERSTGANPTS